MKQIIAALMVGGETVANTVADLHAWACVNEARIWTAIERNQLGEADLLQAEHSRWLNMLTILESIKMENKLNKDGK